MSPETLEALKKLCEAIAIFAYQEGETKAAKELTRTAEALYDLLKEYCNGTSDFLKP